METSRANVLIHRSDGQTFAMDDRPIGLLELKGVDAPAMEVFTETLYTLIGGEVLYDHRRERQGVTQGGQKNG